MSVLKSLFGCVWVLGGHPPQVSSFGGTVISPAAISHKISKISIAPNPTYTPEFWEAEAMGVMPPLRCDSCKGCMQSGPCSERHFQNTVQKQAELDLIQSKTKLVNGEVWVEYPFIKSPACLPYNRDKVIQAAERVERGVNKD